MSKNLVLIRDVLVKYHPDFVKNRTLQKMALSRPHIFNVERLIEEALAAVGGYNFVDETGRDFDCPNNSDSKTASLLRNKNSAITLTVSGVECKIGSLRITIYNPFADRVDFMYIPEKKMRLVKRACYGKNQHKQRIIGTWNQFTDSYNSMENFRKLSFEELATARG